MEASTAFLVIHTLMPMSNKCLVYNINLGFPIVLTAGIYIHLVLHRWSASVLEVTVSTFAA